MNTRSRNCSTFTASCRHCCGYSFGFRHWTLTTVTLRSVGHKRPSERTSKSRAHQSETALFQPGRGISAAVIEPLFNAPHEAETPPSLFTRSPCRPQRQHQPPSVAQPARGFPSAEGTQLSRSSVSPLRSGPVLSLVRGESMYPTGRRRVNWETKRSRNRDETPRRSL